MFKSKKNFGFKTISLLVLVFMIASSGIVYAATNAVEAYMATYDTYINGEKIDKSNVLVYNSETYVKVPVLQNYGVNRSWDEDNRIASFQIQNPVVEQTEMTISQSKALQEYSVRFYEGSVAKKNFRGNGTKVSKDTILTTEWLKFNNNGSVNVADFKKLIAVDNNGNEIKLKKNPIATGVQGNKGLVLLQTTGVKFSSWAKLSTKAPVKDDTLIVCGSVSQVPNYTSVNVAVGYEDYDLFDSGMSEYLRTKNNANYSTRGSGIFNSKGELVSMTVGKDTVRKYLLGTTLNDLSSFVGVDSSQN